MSEKNKTILCVGNDAFGLEVRRLVLEAFGYNAIIKPDCSSAMVVLGMRPIDLVIIDFSELTEAPQSCIRAIRERLPQQRMMLLAPIPYVDHEVTDLVDCVMMKGISPEELKVALEKCLNPKSGRGKLAVAMSVAGAWIGVASELLRGHSWRNAAPVARSSVPDAQRHSPRRA